MATELFDIPSFNAVQARIAMILGNGVGDKGYGQPVASTQLITSVTVQNYIDLRADILKARYHQKGNIAAPIPVITNTVNSTIWNAIKATMANVELDRLLIPPASYGFSELLVSETSSSAWNSTTSHTVILQFDNADAMRHYFNTGSYISFTASLTGGLTSGAGGAKKAAWAALFLSIGELRFKYNATTSTKVAGTTKGFRDLTDTDQIFFSKSYADKPSNDVYTISARLSFDNEITFTITFANAGENVTGTIISSVAAFHAGNADSNTNATIVNVPAPYSQSLFLLGTANPTFTPYRSTSVISETGTNNVVTVGVTATNFSGPLFYKIKGTANGSIVSNITASDFIDVPLEGQITIDIDGTTTTPLVITANADNLTEGKETFDIEFRTVYDTTAPVVTSLVGFFKSPITILDTSLTPPTPVLAFKKQSVLTVSKGAIASFTVIGTNVPNNSTVYWEIRSLSGTTLIPSDFKDGIVSGSFTMNNNLYTIDINIVNDTAIEKVAAFQMYVYILDSTKKPIPSSQAYSEMIQIIKTVVAVPDPPFIALPPTVNSILEGSTTGVTFNVTTPLWCTKLWYTVVTDFANDINEVTALDFRDKLIQGFITVSGGKGSLTKYAALDNITEGTETFHVDFFTDEARTSNKFSTPSVDINENIGYTVTRSPLTMIEGSPTGVTFTVSTPYTPNTPQTFLRWTVVSESGTLATSNFYDNLLSDTMPIVDNVASVTLRAKDNGITEGIRQFHLKIETTNGTFLANSPSVSILENVQYNISAQRTIMTEGQTGINFDITTPYLPINTKLYWATIPVTGTITPSDFTDNVMSGYFFINPTTITNSYTLIRASADDGITEGNESFYISLRTSSNPASEVARSEIVTITENVKCRIYPSTQVLTEGQPAMTFRITTMMLPDNTRIYWKINPLKGNVIADDFIVSDDQSAGANRLNGYALTHGNIASFSLAARADSITEDDETFTVSIHLHSINDQAEDTSAELTIHDVSPFIITADVTTVKEAVTSSDLPNANVVTFTVFTPWMPDGTVLYWTTRSFIGIDAADFSDNNIQGTVKVYGNKCTISRQIADDHTTEGTNVFAIQIRRNSFTDPVVPNGTSPSITIIDNSIYPVVPDPSPFTGEATITEAYGKTSVVEGSSVTFVIETTGVATTDDLYWSTLALSSLTGDLSQTESNAVFHVLGSSDPRHKEVTITALTNNDTKGPGGKGFIFRVHHGSDSWSPVIGVLPMVILDPTPYTVSSNPQTINEGGSAIITVTSPLANTTIPWAITTNSGTATTGNNITITGAPSYNSNSLSGTVAVDNTGSGSFTIAAVSNDIVEGTRSINLALTGTSASTVITITESVSFTLRPSSLQFPYSVSANTDVQFTLTTPKLSSTQVTDGLYWTLVGDNLSGNFSALSGQITGLSTTTYSYTFTIHSLISDVDKDVQIQIRTSSATGPQVTNFTTNVNQIKILGSVAYSILLNNDANTSPIASPYSITEGSSFVFQISTPKMLANQTTITWTIVSNQGTMVVDDFIGISALTGTVSSNNKTDTVLIPLSFSTGKKHGDKQFHIQLSVNGSNVEGGTSVTVTRAEAAAYAIVPWYTNAELKSPYIISEGSPITFQITTPNIGSSDKTYTWELVSTTITGVIAPVVSTTDVKTQGLFTISALHSYGEVIVYVPNNNVVDANGRTFQIRIKNESGVVVIPESLCPLIKAVDVVNNQYGITTTLTSVVEGDSIAFTVTRPAGNTDKSVSWTLAKDINTSTFDATQHVTLPSNQTIDFSTGSVQTVTIKTNADTVTNNNRTFNMVLTGKTVTNNPVITIIDPELYSVEDNLGTTKSIDETGNSNTVTFTLHAKTMDNGSPMYYRVTGNVASTDFTAPVITPINNVLIGQTSNVSNKLVTLQFIAAADNKTNKPLKTFYVEFSKTSAFANTVKSNTITINDTSQDALPSIQLAISYVPSPSRIRLGEGFQVECSVLFLQQALSVAGPIMINSSFNASANLLRNVKVDGNLITSSGKMSSALGSRTAIAGPAASNTVYGMFNFTTSVDTTDPCGPIEITFTVTDPVTKKPVSVTSPIVFVQHALQTVEITRASAWQVPTNVTRLSFELTGGGGMGGMYSYLDGTSGYDGGAGDLVSGTIDVTPGQSMYINIVNGGPASLIDPKGIIGQGGQGGAGIVLYSGAAAAVGTPIASAAGGGGGQGSHASNHGVEGNIPTSSSTYSSNLILAGTNIAGATLPTGIGGAGGGGGVHILDISYANNSNGGISYVPSNFTCTPGGASNQGYGNDLTSTIVTYKDPLTGGSIFDTNWGMFLFQYGIFDQNYIALGGATANMYFNQVPITPSGSQIYTLRYASTGCNITIDGVQIISNGKGSTNETGLEKDITLTAGWNHSITVTILMPTTYKPGVTPVSVAATLRRKNDPHDEQHILWATNRSTTLYSLPLQSVAGSPKAKLSYTPNCSGYTNLPNEWTVPGTYTVTVPTGCTKAVLFAVGAGGGSGGGLDRPYWAGSSGGGGGAGGVSKSIVTVIPGATITVVVGKGGAGGDNVVVLSNTSYNNTSIRQVGAGSNGTATTITNNGVTLTANPGLGGAKGVAYFTNTTHPLDSSYIPPLGGAGGTGTLSNGGSGLRGQFDPKGGASTIVVSVGGTNVTPYGGGAATLPVPEKDSQQKSWTHVAGQTGSNGYASITWLY